MPKLTVTLPPRLGDPGTWTLAQPDAVKATSTTLTLRVTRLACSDGKTGTVLRPTVSTSDSQIIVRANVKPRTESRANCPANDAVSVSVTLDEPIGARVLLDAACLEGEAITTSFCVNGAVRWTP